ncbi:putative protein kinase RLK-Pelle-LysM family [Helianthus debilis subsp. tardiflorus]
MLQVKNLVNNLAWWKIPLSDIKVATNDFADRYIIKSHQDDRVYKAKLDDIRGGRTVVIKRIINHKYWTTTDFYAELQMFTCCEHDNVVRLLGFCVEDSEMILVFECSFKQTLDDYLGSTSNKTNLTWEQRIRIALDIANGLKHLKKMELKQRQGMIHPGILSANVTLDEKWTAKIANFRLSNFDSCPVLWLSRLENFRSWLWEANDAPKTPSDEKLVVDDIYSFGRKANDAHKTPSDEKLAVDDIYSFGRKANDAHKTPSDEKLVVDDIYSFGVILFEILTGRLAYDPFYMVDDFNGLASMARLHFNAGKLKNMIDPSIMEEAQNCSYTLKKGPNQYSLDAYSKIAYQCLAESSSERPTLEDVIKSLEKALHFHVSKPLKKLIVVLFHLIFYFLIPVTET